MENKKMFTDVDVFLNAMSVCRKLLPRQVDKGEYAVLFNLFFSRVPLSQKKKHLRVPLDTENINDMRF
jgi:hypothetical protein